MHLSTYFNKVIIITCIYVSKLKLQELKKFAQSYTRKWRKLDSENAFSLQILYSYPSSILKIQNILFEPLTNLIEEISICGSFNLETNGTGGK